MTAPGQTRTLHGDALGTDPDAPGGASNHVCECLLLAADVQRPLELGPLTAALPTFGAQCRFTVAFPTQRQAVLKVAV